MPISPWLSVLIPTYNGEDFLPYALESIVIQGDQDVECIVIDDGSTDASLSILNEYKNKLSIKILSRERNGNWVDSTNYALSLARGEYICFLHQDDIWLMDRLKIMRKLILQSPDVLFFLHPSVYLDINGDSLGPWQCPLPTFPRIISSNLMVRKLLVQNFISIPAPIIKREVAQKVGGLDSTLWYAADWDFWLKIAHCGDALYYPIPLSGFRIHPTSQTVVRSSYLEDFQNQLKTVAKRHLAEWAVPDLEKRKLSKIINFSIQVNTTLAGTLHGKNVHLFKLITNFLLLGPSGGYRYLRDSRLGERISARLRARLKPIKTTSH